jgi:TIR domain-containing protein
MSPELPELVGFFSYSRKDDEYSDGALSRLRIGIHNELRLQLGRDIRLWQDTAAIPHGVLWEEEITKAIAESTFFIPIVTPSAVASPHCKFEFESFLARESALLRRDLVFPVLYVPVPALKSEHERRQNDVLRIIHARQYADWIGIRLDDIASPDVKKKICRFCEDIVRALRKTTVRPAAPPAKTSTEEIAPRATAASHESLARESKAYARVQTALLPGPAGVTDSAGSHGSSLGVNTKTATPEEDNFLVQLVKALEAAIERSPLLKFVANQVLPKLVAIIQIFFGVLIILSILYVIIGLFSK